MLSLMTLAADDDWSDDTNDMIGAAADYLRGKIDREQFLDSGVYPIPSERRDTIPALPLWMAEIDAEVA